MENLKRVVLAIDPGRAKCGVAVVSATVDNPTPQVLHRSVIDTNNLPQTAAALIEQFTPERILIGDGTTSKSAREMLSAQDCPPVEVVDEKFTTLLARERYFKENPPRGLRRLIPVSLQTPPTPYDDYVAIILAERYLTS